MYAELERKVCTRCEKNKALNEFYLASGGKKLRPECKKCSNGYTKKYRGTESGKAAINRARSKYLSSPDNVERDKQNKAEWARFKKYGMVKSEFIAMLQEQNFKCYLCPVTHETGRGLVVDHCHTTGKVRKLLCDGCNRGLGFFKEDPNALTAAVAYLEKFKK